MNKKTLKQSINEWLENEKLSIIHYYNQIKGGQNLVVGHLISI